MFIYVCFCVWYVHVYRSVYTCVFACIYVCVYLGVCLCSSLQFCLLSFNVDYDPFSKGISSLLMFICYEGSWPETNTWTHWNLRGKSLLLASGCMGNLQKSCSPEPYSSLSFVHKNHNLVVTFQLARGRTAEAKEQGYALSSLFPVWKILRPTCCVLRSEWCL